MSGARRPSSIAVVVPTHERRELLADTIASIKAQTRSPDEVVIVSDGSTDGTNELVRAHDFTLVVTDHVGAAGARNAGWRHTATELVAFIDDDCTAEPTWLEMLERGFADSSVGVIQGRTVPAGPVGPFDRTLHVISERGLYETCNIAYRRQTLEEVGGFDETFGARLLHGRPFGEDTELAWRVRRRGWQTRFCTDAVVRHAVFPGSMPDALREEWRKRHFPWLVHEIPELAERLPRPPCWLRRQSPVAQLALVALLLAVPTRGRSLAGTVPYALWLTRNSGSVEEATRQAARDLVASMALVAGSLQHRRLVL